MKRVTLLGGTGSVGLRALELVSSFPEEFAIAGFGARGSNVEPTGRTRLAAHPAPSILPNAQSSARSEGGRAQDRPLFTAGT